MFGTPMHWYRKLVLSISGANLKIGALTQRNTVQLKSVHFIWKLREKINST